MRRRIWIGIVGAALGTLLSAQEPTGDKVTVPFRDPSKPRTVIVTLINGGMTIRGYDGKDAIIESSGRTETRRRGRPSSVPDGMHEIGPGSGGLDVTEDNNVITVRGGISRSADIVMQVPTQTSLRVKTMNGGKIVIDNISGEIEAENTNGSLQITNVSGSVLANSMNGRVEVSLNRVTPNKTMSFSTMNGTVDVTLPADLKANLKMKTDNGSIFSDFDIKLEGSKPPEVDNSGGRYHVRIDKSLIGTINGGGPEIQFTTFNGSILIHKK